MSLLSAIRIMLYLFLTYTILSQPLTLVTGLLATVCVIIAVAIGLLEYYTQLSYDDKRALKANSLVAQGKELDSVGYLLDMPRKRVGWFGGYEDDETYRKRMYAVTFKESTKPGS